MSIDTTVIKKRSWLLYHAHNWPQICIFTSSSVPEKVLNLKIPTPCNKVPQSEKYIREIAKYTEQFEP